MNKLMLILAAITASTILYGCASTTYTYKNVTYTNPQERFQAIQTNNDQLVRAVKPLDNFLAKSAIIVVPDRKICQILIGNKTFMTSKNVIDHSTEVNFLYFNSRADQIIKRNIFETTKKTEGECEYPFETKNYDYIIYLGSEKQADRPPEGLQDYTWWIKHKNGKYQTKIKPITSNNEVEVTLSFLQQMEDFVSKTEPKVKGIKRYNADVLKQGTTEPELRNYYGSIKELIFDDPFTSNIKYNIILFKALPSLNTKEANNDIAYTYWAMFQENKAIAFGVGEEKEAKHSIYSALVNKKNASGKLKQSKAERMIFDNFRKLYGEPEPITKEIAMFRIMVAEKIETGKILQSEADYLMAQKEAEIAERIKEIQRKEEQLLKDDAVRRELIELQQRQLANQQQANEIAQRQANTQALMGVANYINQQTYQQQLIQSLNRPFSMNCWSNGHYTNCRQQ
ncbi:MAG: hypothetical protein AB2L12_13390 [Smithellaceae bacterium]